MKPYGAALVRLAQSRADVVCLRADPDEADGNRFVSRSATGQVLQHRNGRGKHDHGVAGGLARAGHTVFVNTFGVFATRRCFDQLAMAVSYPNLNVKIVGFMPGISTPGGRVIRPSTISP